jgi:hypothetical protein
MSEAMVFLVCWLGFMAVVFGALAVAWNFDRLVVLALDLTDIPVFAEARMVAALIYRHPEQWTIGSYAMKHPEIGELSSGHCASVRVEGSFGRWEPNLFERRIIWNAIMWRQRSQIRTLARKQIG